MTPIKNKPIIGISIGDCNGIGPEVIMKALSDPRLIKNFVPVIYGHGKILSFYRKLLSMDEFNFAQIRQISEFQPKRINVINVEEESPEVSPGVEAELSGSFALACFKAAVGDLKEGRIQALVTAPVNKNNINSEQQPFVGHTEFITEATGKSSSLMMMVSEDFRVGLVTGHMPISSVATAISTGLVLEKAQLMLKSLKKDFGINKPRIAVLGLNPHAGEDGLLGKEEIDVIQPAIHQLKDKNEYVFGPYPADDFFGMMQQKKFDGVLAMYHDQGLIPFKSMAFDSGVNFTAGLPVIRTSPDHGTAYPISGKNIADPGSMRSALFLAYDIIKMHSTIEEYSR